MLISTSDDRTYKVWNLSSFECIYNSPIISAYPISAISLSLSTHPLNLRQILVIATDDGNLHLHEFIPTSNTSKDSLVEIRSLRILKTSSLFPATPASTRDESTSPPPAVVSSLPKWKQNPQYLTPKSTLESVDDIATPSTTCTFLQHLTVPCSSTTTTPPKTYLLVATQTSITLLDASSFDSVHSCILQSAGFVSILGCSQIQPEIHRRNPESRRILSTTSNSTTASGFFEFLVHQRITRELKMYRVTIPRSSDSTASRRAVFGRGSGALGDSAVDLFAVQEDAEVAADSAAVVGGMRDVVARFVAGPSGGGGVWGDRLCNEMLVELARLDIRELEDLVSRGGGEVEAARAKARRDKLRNWNGGEGGGVSVLSSGIREGILRTVEELFGVDEGSVRFGFRVEADDGDLKRTAGPATPKKLGVASAKPSASKPVKPQPASVTGSAKKSGTVLNQPITFRKTVKSSGYTQEPIATKLFKLPKIASASKPSLVKASSPSPRPSSASSSSSPNNFWLDSLDSEPLTKSSCSTPPFATFPHAGPVTCIKFNASGSALAVGCVSKSAYVHKIASATSKGFHGHEASVSHVYWGSEGRMP
ncbi:hypothetical protein HDU98_011133 [Podochytrium sp. JEL0797]|nr:hypothetical protein HDU98_011133 [Podochytrium sp. JEL0797]